MNIKEMLEMNEESDQTFFKIDGLDLRYSVNKKGLIWDNKHLKPLYPIFWNNNLYYQIYVNNKRERITLDKLYLMSFSPMHTSFDIYQNELKVVKYDKTVVYPRNKNLIWLIPNGGIENKNYPGYFSIVGNQHISVSKNNEFINVENNKKFKITYFEGRYPVVGTRQQDKESYPFSTQLVHRLIALAFIPIPLNKENLIINHKDGNKENFNLSNLEWVTYTQNNVHAFTSGLRSDNEPILVVNIDTEEKKVFYSLQEAARELKIHAWTIAKSRDTYSSSGILKTAPWLFLKPDSKVPTSFKRIRDKTIQTRYCFFKITNNDTREIKYVRGIENLKKFLHSKKVGELYIDLNPFIFNHYTIQKVCREQLPKDFQFRDENNNSGGKAQKPIRVTDLTNGTVITYKSTDEFATLVGAKRKTIQHGVHFTGGFWHNFKIEYL